MNRWHKKLGLAHEFGLEAFDRLKDIGLMMEKKKPEKGGNASREPLPSGHRFFDDCLRETNARMIEYFLTRTGIESWFVNLTFKRYVSERKAWNMLSAWLVGLEKGYGHAVPWGQGLKWVVAQEWQKRNVIHFHVLVGGVLLGKLSRKRWEYRWSAQGGGFARIYDASLKSAPYLAKYTSKGLGGALKWGGTWQGTSFPKSVGCCRE